MTGRTASPATSTHLLAGAEAVGTISGQQHCESQVLGGGVLVQSAVPEPWLGGGVGSWALGSDGAMLPLNHTPVPAGWQALAWAGWLLGVPTTAQPSRARLDAASAPNG